MKKTIKTRKASKRLNKLDRAAGLSRKMKKAAVRAKEKTAQAQSAQYASPSEYAAEHAQSAAQGKARAGGRLLKTAPKRAAQGLGRAKDHFHTVGQQMPQARQRTAAEAQKAAQTTQGSAAKLRNTATQTNQTATQAKTAVTDAKNTLRNIRHEGRQAIRQAKAANRGIKQPAKSTVKTAKKSVKTAERTAKSTVKTAQQAARTAHQSARAATKAAKTAERAARSAAKTAAKASKAAARGVMAMVKATIAAARGLVTAIAAGGWVAVFIILIVCVLGLLIASPFGIFFSSEPNPATGQTMGSVIAEIDAEYTSEIDSIIAGNPHNLLDMSGARALWKDVLAVYTVKAISDPAAPMEVATVDDAKAALLRTTFWAMNAIDYVLDTTQTVVDILDADGLPTGETDCVTQTVLRITVTHKAAMQMAEDFSDSQTTQLAELLLPEYHGLWNALLYGITSIGDGTMLEIASTQLGNIGGAPYWSWYGFASREDWCACFVSWVAEQCGYLDVTIPRFAAVSEGVRWFQDRGQWQGSAYTPRPGDLIFFDWEPDGQANHVGIVESITDGCVNTIEGNASDSVARRSYDLGSVKIFGYGVPGR